MRTLQIPEEPLQKMRETGPISLFKLLEEECALPDGYTFWQLQRTVQTGLCHEFEMDMFIKAGLMEGEYGSEESVEVPE